MKADIDFDHLIKTPGAARAFARDAMDWKINLPPDAGIVLGLAIVSQRVDVVEQLLDAHPGLVTQPCMNDGRFYQRLGIKATGVAQQYLVLSPAPVLPLTLACFQGDPGMVATLLKAGAPSTAVLENPWGKTQFNPFALLVNAAFDQVDRSAPEGVPPFDRQGWTEVVHAFSAAQTSPLEKCNGSSVIVQALGGLAEVGGRVPRHRTWCLPLLQLVTRHCALRQSAEEDSDLRRLFMSFIHLMDQVAYEIRPREKEPLLNPVPRDIRDEGGVVHSTIMATVVTWLQDAGLESSHLEELGGIFSEVESYREQKALSAALPVGAPPVRASRI
jgi:hypothetical protein